MANEGKASWTLEQQRKKYKELKEKHSSPVSRVESQLQIKDKAAKILYVKAKLISLEKELSSRN